MMTTVMFDLDGTLLPFEQEDFIRIYFSELCKKLAPLGYKPEGTVKSVWAGTGMMIKNDGSRENSAAFWEMFRKLNPDMPDAKELCDEFYLNEFRKAESCLKYKPNHKAMIDRIKAAGFKTVLATNPIFPLNGVITRMAWVGLSPDDFDFVTHYDNSTFCKPNPSYFTEILKKIGEKPENCIMVGNNVSEDMQCAKAAGLDAYLVTEFLENPNNEDYSAFRQGTIAEAADYVLSRLN